MSMQRLLILNNLLLWSLPIAFSLHVVEEFAFPGGLKQWIQAYKPGKIRSDFYCFIVNAAAIVGAIIIAVKASGNSGFLIYLYRLLAYPPARALELKLREYARAHATDLIKVLEDCADDTHRAAAKCGCSRQRQPSAVRPGPL